MLCQKPQGSATQCDHVPHSRTLSSPYIWCSWRIMPKVQHLMQVPIVQGARGEEIQKQDASQCIHNGGKPEPQALCTRTTLQGPYGPPPERHYKGHMAHPLSDTARAIRPTPCATAPAPVPASGVDGNTGSTPSRVLQCGHLCTGGTHICCTMHHRHGACQCRQRRCQSRHGACHRRNADEHKGDLQEAIKGDGRQGSVPKRGAVPTLCKCACASVWQESTNAPGHNALPLSHGLPLPRFWLRPGLRCCSSVASPLE